VWFSTLQKQHGIVTQRLPHGRTNVTARTFLYSSAFLHIQLHTANVIQMFRQVWIHKTQTLMQTILWREDPNKKLETFDCKTVTYETASAIFLAVKAMHEITQSEAITHPIGASIVINDFYVMTYWRKRKSKKKQSRFGITPKLQKGGFQLRKWASNSRLKDISHTNATEPIHFINKSEDMHTLGMHWKTTTDTL